MSAALDIAPKSIAIDQVTLDIDLQPRTEIDQETLVEYGHRLQEGETFPPVVVFLDGATYWLADGYHRLHAHKALGRTHIEAIVRQGTKRLALMHSLAANAEHGKPRSGSDLRKAYAIAVRMDVVDPISAEAVASVLRCTVRWARELTREARDEADRERDEAVREAVAAGASLREAAARVGTSKGTVERAVKAGPERKASTPGRASAPAVVPIADASPWSDVLHALRAVHHLGPAEELDLADPLAGDAARLIADVVGYVGSLARRLDVGSV